METVAARAGVSRATVSRVVNGEPSVRPVVRARVLAAVEELGYVPNQAARSLATRRSGVVALVLAGPRQDNATLVAAVAQYVTSVLEAAGRQVALMLADTAESHRRILARVEAREVDGVILLPPDRGDTLTERLAGTGVPVVVLGRPGGTAVPYVDVDDAGGGAAVARHLGERGQPGHLWKPEQPTQSGQPGQSGPSGPSGQGGLVVLAGPGVAARERVAGFLGAVPAGGVTPVVVEAGAGVEAGVLAMQRVLADGARPGGVFAVTDQLAIGAIRALRAAGLRVPEDVAVAGFGDGAAGRHLTPGLTTVGVAETEQALALARCLLAALEGHTVVPAVLPVRLIVRESTVSGEWPGGR
nr:LacI family DNA-binding transcriptional regulator [Nonomuraea typhae]